MTSINNHKKRRIGITGGIGSGKTTVCKLFELLGIPVYYADDRARWLMTHDQQLKMSIKKLLGDKAFTESGELNRPHIAKIVFSDGALLSQLNALVHPVVERDAARWHEAQKDAPYTLKEAALLFESGSYVQLDAIIVVTAPKEIRIKRVMERDGLSRSDVEKRMSNQLPEGKKVEMADYLIRNDGRHSLIRQVLDLHHKLKYREQNTADAK